MRPYIVACYEVLRRRRLLEHALSGAEADALVTALGLRESAVRLAAELMDPDGGHVVTVPASCPQCAARDHSEAIELVLRL